MRRLGVLLLVCAAGCMSAQVAQKARTSDDQAAVVVAQIKALGEFDADAEQDAQKLHNDLSGAMDTINAAVCANSMRQVIDAWDTLAEVEQRAASAVERAKMRRKAHAEVKATADTLKANTAETATLAEANAAQVSIITGLVGGGLGLPVGGSTTPPTVRPTPPAPGKDYTGEVVTVLMSLITAGASYGVGKRMMAKRPAPAPDVTPRPNGNGHTNGGSKPAPRTQPDVNVKVSATAHSVDPHAGLHEVFENSHSGGT